MKILKQLGMHRNWTYEAVVASGIGRDRNAAAMGFKTRDHSCVMLEAYKSSRTCRNILEEKEFSINLSSSTLLMYRSLFDKGSIRFTRSKKVCAPSIAGVDAVIEARVKWSRDLGDRMLFTAEVVFFHKKKGSKPMALINRADSLVLEALIKASRLSLAKGRKRVDLLKEIRCISVAAQRVAPGSPASRVSQLILDDCA